MGFDGEAAPGSGDDAWFAGEAWPPDPQSAEAMADEAAAAGVAPWDGPDALGRVSEMATVQAVHAATMFVRVDELHRHALADAERHGRELTGVVERGIRLELAAELRITEYAADRLLARADALVHRYPAVLDALFDARITERHAEILADAVDEVEPEHRDAIVPRALALAVKEPVGTFTRALKTLIETVRALTLAERHASAVERRRASVEPVGDAMAWLGVLMPAVEARAAFDRVTATAKVILAGEGETRTLDQIRADIIADLLIDGDTHAIPADARGIRASVVVTVPALSLLDDEAAATADPPVVEGVGPIPLHTARELCGGSTEWMRILTHPETGMVLSVGRDLYRPPPALRRLIRWRADRCMAPGCGMPASRCQIDHNIAFSQGGETSLMNCCPICKGHHDVKHRGGWSIRQLADGSIEWISPSGRHHLVEPERRVPVFTIAPDPPPPF